MAYEIPNEPWAVILADKGYDTIAEQIRGSRDTVDGLIKRFDGSPAQYWRMLGVQGNHASYFARLNERGTEAVCRTADTISRKKGNMAYASKTDVRNDLVQAARQALLKKRPNLDASDSEDLPISEIEAKLAPYYPPNPKQ